MKRKPSESATSERAPSMQFYFRQFSGDECVAAMDLDAIGAHILLMCAAGASAHGHRLASNERLLRAQVHYPSDEDWERIKGQLLQGAWKISKDGKWWVQDGQGRTLAKQKVYREEQKRKALLGARARWHDSGHSQSMPAGIARNSPNHASSSSSSSSSSKDLKPAQNRRVPSTPSEQKRKIEARDTRLAKEAVAASEAQVGAGPSGNGGRPVGILNQREYFEFCELRKRKELPEGVMDWPAYLDHLERTVPGFVRKTRSESESQTETGQEKK